MDEICREKHRFLELHGRRRFAGLVFAQRGHRPPRHRIYQHDGACICPSPVLGCWPPAGGVTALSHHWFKATVALCATSGRWAVAE